MSCFKTATVSLGNTVNKIMKAKAKDLIFISQIKRDGSGTAPVSESYLKAMLENTLMKDDEFDLYRLSI